MEAAENTNPVDGLPVAPSIFQSYIVAQKDQPSASAEVRSSIPAMQRERTTVRSASEEEQETRQHLLELKEKAQKELDTKSPAIRKFCRGTGDTWKLERVCNVYMRVMIVHM